MNIELARKLYPIGKVINVTIFNVENFGAYTVLLNEIIGYIPVSEIAWSKSILDARDVLAIGDKNNVVIKGYDSHNNLILLSIKGTNADPYPDYRNNHKIDEIIFASVISVHEKSAYLEIDNKISARIFLSEVWPNADRMEKVMLVGDEIAAKIIAFDDENSEVHVSAKNIFSEELDIQPIATSKIGDLFEDTFDRLLYKIQKKTELEIKLSEIAKQNIKSILIIEEDKEMAENIALRFHLLELQTTIITDPQIAINEYKSKNFDLIFTSIEIKESNATEFISNIRNISHEVPIIVQLTYSEFDNNIEKIKKLGLIENIIFKPWELKDLVSIINKIFENYKTINKQVYSSPESDFLKTISSNFMESFETRDSILNMLNKIQEVTSSSYIIIFQLNLTTFETTIYKSVGWENKLSFREIDFLRYSPIKDVIFDEIELIDNKIEGKKFQHLIPIGNFKSLLGFKSDFQSQFGYGIFYFGNEENYFSKNQIIWARISTILISTAIKRIHFEDAYKSQHKLIIAGQLSSALIHELSNEQNKIFGCIDSLRNDSMKLNNGELNIDDQYIIRFESQTNRLYKHQSNVSNIHRMFINLVKEENIYEIDICEFMEQLVQSFRPYSKQYHVEIISNRKRLNKLKINIALLSQVITNLLLNAIEQISTIRNSTGTVCINTTYCKDDSLPYKIEISDNGPGIHKIHQERIFNMFFTTKTNGTGLGLYISKAIMNSLNGKISLKKSIRYEGSSFLVELT